MLFLQLGDHGAYVVIAECQPVEEVDGLGSGAMVVQQGLADPLELAERGEGLGVLAVLEMDEAAGR